MRKPSLVNRDFPAVLFAHHPGMTSCAYCDSMLKLSEAVVVTRDITETCREEEHYCSRQCADEWRRTFHADE